MAPIIHGVDHVLLEVDWTNYFATSTKVGWSAYGAGQYINYKKIGGLVFVQYDVDGTSNSVNTTFTLPYTASNTGAGVIHSLYIIDNGVGQAIPGIGTLNANAALVTFSKDFLGTLWTASGYKRILGEFFYQAA